MRVFWSVAIGAAIGGVSRYYLGAFVQQRAGMDFPAGTFLVNISGSFLLGFIMRYALHSGVISAEMRALLTTGFCGGYTTFSTFAQETLDLVEAHDLAIAVVSVSANVVLGVLAVLLGTKLGRLT